MRTTLLLLSFLVVSLSGCSDDGGGGEGTTTTSSSTTGTTTNTGTGGANPGGAEPEPLPPIELTGSSQGVIDCTLIAQGQAPVLGHTQSVPAEASGRAYSIAIDVGPTPLPSSVCITWDGASASNSGTVPDGAAEVGVYVDAGPQGVSYTITIE